MYVLGILSVVFLAVLDVVVCQASPCPDVFQFRYGSDGLSGYIKVIPSDFSKNVDLSISFAAPMDFPHDGAWVLEPINQVSSHAINLGVPLWYRVKFPAGSSVPELTSLLVNDVELCPGVKRSANTNGVTLRHYAVLDSGSGSVSPLTPSPFFAGSGPVINIGQQQIIHYHFNSPQDYQSHSFPHEFFTPRPGLSSRPQFQPPTSSFGGGGIGDSSAPVFSKPPTNIRRPWPVPPPLTPWTNGPPPFGPSAKRPTQQGDRPSGFQPNSENIECGLSVNPGPEALDTGGSYNRGDWPWTVAIYHKTDTSLRYACIGSLVSDRHVITVAHCINSRVTRRAPQDIIVRPGAFVLSKWNEEDVQTRSLSSFAIHPNFDTSSFSNDIAVLTLEKPVRFSRFVKPVCLWSGDKDLDKIVGYEGIVTGWGEGEAGETPNGPPNYVKLPIVSTDTCLKSNYEFIKLTSNNTFCAGSRNGAGPCKGDSGGGLFVAQNSRWIIRGIVSLALVDPVKRNCDLSQYIVLTDVAQYLPWIRDIMSASSFDRQPWPAPPPIVPSTNAPPPPPASDPVPEDVKSSDIAQNSKNIDCGLSVNSGPEALDIGGSYNRGDWPWTVAIYHKTDTTLRYACIGSLVSDRHIITAAHCISNRRSSILPKDLVLKAGGFELSNWNEEDVQDRTLSSYVIHPKYNTSTLSNDIAIGTLKEPVRFSSFVKPVCLWSGDMDLDKVVGNEGIITGWGESEEGKTPNGPPNYAKMPIVSTASCRASHEAFLNLTSNTTLCAGARNGAGPCTGDSGGGLFLARNGRWVIRGVVSIALFDQERGCDLSQYIVFTDVAKFLPWIRNVMSALPVVKYDRVYL